MISVNMAQKSAEDILWLYIRIVRTYVSHQRFPPYVRLRARTALIAFPRRASGFLGGGHIHVGRRYRLALDSGTTGVCLYVANTVFRLSW